MSVDRPELNKKRKAEVLQFLSAHSRSYNVPVNVFGKRILAVLDTGATASAIAKHMVPEHKIQRKDAVALQVASGEYIYSLGTTSLEMEFGSRKISHTAYVVDSPPLRQFWAPTSPKVPIFMAF